jgi:hypothetical protein
MSPRREIARRRSRVDRLTTRRVELVCFDCGDPFHANVEVKNGRAEIVAFCPRCQLEVDDEPVRVTDPGRAPPAAGISGLVETRIGGRRT